MTLGLIRLQAIAREFGTGAPWFTATLSPVVLVAPQRGEAHMLGAALDAELLWHAGWNPRPDFPANSRARDGLVASAWIDAFDLSLTTCFERDHRLGEVGRTIASARRASLNPNLVVVVSGRVFSEHPEASELAAAPAPTRLSVRRRRPIRPFCRRSALRCGSGKPLGSESRVRRAQWTGVRSGGCHRAYTPCFYPQRSPHRRTRTR